MNQALDKSSAAYFEELAQDLAFPARASRRLEASEAERQSCRHMGSGVPGFTALARSLHDEAEGISKAARDANGQVVLAAAAAGTLAICTSCDARYCQEVVAPDSWQPPTGAEHESHHGPSE